MCNNCIHAPVCGKCKATGGQVGKCEHFKEERHGRWDTDRFGLERSICSVCHVCYEGDGGNFCPNCGAKMDGGVENG